MGIDGIENLFPENTPANEDKPSLPALDSSAVSQELDEALARNDGQVVPLVYHIGNTAVRLGDAKIVKDDQGIRIDAAFTNPEQAAILFGAGGDIRDIDYSFEFRTEDMRLMSLHPLLRPIYKTDDVVKDMVEEGGNE